MRKDKELLTIAIENFDKHFQDGLCYYVNTLRQFKIIDFLEYSRLREIIKKNIVSYSSIFRLFVDKRRIKAFKYHSYYWPIGNKEERLNYLEYLFEKYSK